MNKVINPEELKKFATTLSKQPLGLVSHIPENWAQNNMCFRNVSQKIKFVGGNTQYGWTFNHRLPLHINNSAGYLVATHHAVWHSPNNELVDITPFNTDRKHHPFTVNTNILFQIDDKAKPFLIEDYPLSLPLRFFALSDENSLVSYVEHLNKKEQNEWEEYCQKALASI